MLDVCEMVKAITFGTGKEDFTSPTNAKKRLRKFLRWNVFQRTGGWVSVGCLYRYGHTQGSSPHR